METENTLIVLMRDRLAISEEKKKFFHTRSRDQPASTPAKSSDSI